MRIGFFILILSSCITMQFYAVESLQNSAAKAYGKQLNMSTKNGVLQLNKLSDELKEAVLVQMYGTYQKALQVAVCFVDSENCIDNLIAGADFYTCSEEAQFAILLQAKSLERFKKLLRMCKFADHRGGVNGGSFGRLLFNRLNLLADCSDEVFFFLVDNAVVFNGLYTQAPSTEKIVVNCIYERIKKRYSCDNDLAYEKDLNGRTLLFYAVVAGLSDEVAYVLNVLKADRNAFDKLGKSPLWYCQDPLVAEWLVASGQNSEAIAALEQHLDTLAFWMHKDFDEYFAGQEKLIEHLTKVADVIVTIILHLDKQTLSELCTVATPCTKAIKNLLINIGEDAPELSTATFFQKVSCLQGNVEEDKQNLFDQWRKKIVRAGEKRAGKLDLRWNSKLYEMQKNRCTIS